MIFRESVSIPASVRQYMRIDFAFQREKKTAYRFSPSSPAAVRVTATSVIS